MVSVYSTIEYLPSKTIFRLPKNSMCAPLNATKGTSNLHKLTLSSLDTSSPLTHKMYESEYYLMNGVRQMKLKTLLKITLIFCVLLSILIYSSPVTEGIKRGLTLGITVVVPSLFPFTVVSLIFFHTISGINLFSKGYTYTIFIYIMSLIGGFPVGAKLIEEAYNKKIYTRQNAETALSFCVNAAPSYIVTATGIMLFNSFKMGLILFASSVLSSALILLLQKNRLPQTAKCVKSLKMNFSEIIVESTSNAAGSMIGIVAFISLFTGVSGVFKTLFTESRLLQFLLSPLEITAGIYDTANVYIAAFLIGFSGFCVHFQIMAICKSIKPSYLKFFAARVLQGILCILITFILLKIFPIEIETINVVKNTFAPSSISATFSIALIFCLVFFMLSVKSKNKIV